VGGWPRKRISLPRRALEHHSEVLALHGKLENHYEDWKLVGIRYQSAVWSLVKKGIIARTVVANLRCIVTNRISQNLESDRQSLLCRQE
jgi:hypothetical protein